MPSVIPAILPKALDLSFKDVKCFSLGIAVKRHNHAGRNDAPDQGRRSEELNAGAEHVRISLVSTFSARHRPKAIASAATREAAPLNSCVRTAQPGDTALTVDRTPRKNDVSMVRKF